MHGFGVEKESIADLGCDFFVAGCHKWMFGPRGTGIIWGRPSVDGAPGSSRRSSWAAFSVDEGKTPDVLPPGPRVSPGGFHSFEHRWALAEAFRSIAIGKPRSRRASTSSTPLQAGLAAIEQGEAAHADGGEVSAGIICFEIAGMKPNEIVERLRAKKIIASDSPYVTSYARLRRACSTRPRRSTAPSPR